MKMNVNVPGGLMLKVVNKTILMLKDDMCFFPD